MSELERLFEAYGQHVALPWSPKLPAPQRVWFLPYAPDDERRLRYGLGRLKNSTERANKRWSVTDLTGELPRWVGSHKYAREFFEEPKDAEMALDGEFFPSLVDRVRSSLDPAADTVNCVVGVGALFGSAKISLLVDRIASEVEGRLLVPFPGRIEGKLFRLLDARDGWNYHATVIAPVNAR